MNSYVMRQLVMALGYAKKSRKTESWGEQVTVRGNAMDCLYRALDGLHLPHDLPADTNADELIRNALETVRISASTEFRPE